MKTTLTLNNPELIAFADWFSKNYTILHEADYHSKNKKYHLRYVGGEKYVWSDTGEINNNFNRISAIDLRFELNQTELLKHNEITSDYVFFIILWCAAREHSLPYTETAKETDTQAATFYNTTNRSSKKVIDGWLCQLSQIPPSDSLKERTENLINILK